VANLQKVLFATIRVIETFETLEINLASKIPTHFNICTPRHWIKSTYHLIIECNHGLAIRKLFRTHILST
jgi:hypothetical protein